MTRRAHLVVVRLLSLAAAAFALLPRPASAWWETTVTTNKWEYDGVEYLESSGTQYIDTGLYGSNLLDYDCLFTPSSVPTSYGAGTVFGARKLYNSLAYQLTTYKSADGTGGHFDYYNQGVRCYAAMTAGITNRIRKAGLTFYRADGTTESLSSGSWQTSYIIYLFCLNQQNVAVEYISAKMHSLLFWYSGELVRNYIPVLHEGEGKMLDLVSGTLYANAGTGAFTYGAVTGTVTYTQITTNRVYHANPPASAYDALSPWNAPERTRIGGDDTTLRPSAIIKEN